MKELNLNVNAESVREYYESADEDGKKLLELLFGKAALVPEKPKDVKERVKTFEDARNELGEDNPLVSAYEGIADYFGDDAEDVKAYMQLRIIVAALNEGWTPNLDEHETRWYPWFYIYTPEEYAELSESDKRRCVGRANSIAYAYGGLVCSNAGGASSGSSASGGVRLALKSEELADYAGQQFGEIYAAMMLG